ncbi:putative SPEAR family protein [Helianthus anomalus]
MKLKCVLECMGSMAHEEHTHRCGKTAGDCGDDRLSKKMKHNKVSHRGMGVAQLEKILEEQHGVLTPNSVKFQRPEIPLSPRFPPNRHPLISNTSIWPQFPAQISQLQLPCSSSMMVGMKRSYPFSLENIPPAYLSPISKPNQKTSSSRENPSSLGSIKNQKTKKFISENFDLAKDFLTLAPPQPSPPSHSRFKEKLQPSSVTELTRPYYQGQTRDACEKEWSNQQALHSFFPATKTQGNSNGEVGEHVDLNLKL